MAKKDKESIPYKDIPILKKIAKKNKAFVERMIKNISYPSLVGLDYADVKSILNNNKNTLLVKGTKIPKDWKKSKGAIVLMMVSVATNLDDISKISEEVYSNLEPKSNVIWGATVSEELKKPIVETLLAK